MKYELVECGRTFKVFNVKTGEFKEPRILFKFDKETYVTEIEENVLPHKVLLLEDDEDVLYINSISGFLFKKAEIEIKEKYFNLKKSFAKELHAKINFIKREDNYVVEKEYHILVKEGRPVKENRELYKYIDGFALFEKRLGEIDDTLISIYDISGIPNAAKLDEFYKNKEQFALEYPHYYRYNPEKTIKRRIIMDSSFITIFVKEGDDIDLIKEKMEKSKQKDKSIMNKKIKIEKEK